MQQHRIDSVVSLILETRKSNSIENVIHQAPWNKSCVTFSQGNHLLNRNVRSYFDRWRDRPDESGSVYEIPALDVTWSLIEKR